MQRRILALSLLLAAPIRATADEPPPAALAAPTNLGLEEAGTSGPPAGFWAKRSNPAYDVARRTDGAAEGKSCGCVTFLGAAPAAPNDFGMLRQTIDAAPYRGKRVRVRGLVRVESELRSWGGLMLRVERAGGVRGFSDVMQDRPITSQEWKPYAIVGDVAEDAVTVDLGVQLSGGGSACVDALALEVLGKIGEGDEAARPLTARGRENVAAFGKLLGYVRFFHPSDGAAATDWHRFAIEGVRKVEDAEDAVRLAARLQDLFAPLAPTIRVFAGEEAPPLPAELSAPGRAVAWRHVGIELQPQTSFRSQRVDDLPPGPDVAARVEQVADAAVAAGKTVRLRAWLKTDLREGAAGCRLAIAALGPRGTLATKEGAPFTAPQWRLEGVELELPAGTERIAVSVSLAGAGRILIDDTAAEVDEPTGAVRSLLKNGGFEEDAGRGTPPGWSLAGGDDRYRLTATKEAAQRGSRGAMLEGARRDLPSPEAPLVVALGGGVHASVPLAVKATDAGTIPAGTPFRGGFTRRPEGWTPSGNDRATRLADVVLAWTVLHHFFPYFDAVPVDWDAELSRALGAAATDRDAAAFARTLRRLLVTLQDGHGRVSFEDPGFLLPLAWTMVGDRLVVTNVDRAVQDVVRGDVVRTIDGVAVLDAIRRVEEEIPGATASFVRARALMEVLPAGARDAERVIEVEHADGSVGTARVRCTFPRADAYPEALPEPIAEVRPGIFYVDAYRATDAMLTAALPRLAAAEGIVVDVRMYPKVKATFLAHLADHPLEGPTVLLPVVTRPDRDSVTFEPHAFALPPREPRITARVAFLASGRVVSYGETFLAMVAHHRLGEIVGEATAGTNGDMNTMILPGGYRLSFTGAKVLGHDGGRHHGVGVLATVPVGRTVAGIRAGRDEVLERGIEVVSAP